MQKAALVSGFFFGGGAFQKIHFGYKAYLQSIFMPLFKTIA
jgi:hypothetical protein